MRLFLRTTAVILLFALFSAPIAFVGNPTSPAYEKLENLLKTSVSLDFAIIGDSRAHTGLSPSELSRILNTRTSHPVRGYNFAVDGTDILHHFSFAKNGLSKLAPKPKVVLWTPNPLHFNDVRTSNRLEQLLPSDGISLARAGAPFELLLDIYTMAVFKPWRHKPMVTRMLSDYSERAGLRTLPVQQKVLGLHYEKEAPSREYIALEDGQEPFTVLEWKDRFRRGAESYTTDYAALKLSQWHFNLAALFATELANQGIKLVIIEMPVAPWFQTHLANTDKHLEWRTRLQEIAASTGAIYLEHSNFMKGSDSLFGDPGHMPRETAILYSQELAEILLKMGLFDLKKGGS